VVSTQSTTRYGTHFFFFFFFSTKSPFFYSSKTNKVCRVGHQKSSKGAKGERKAKKQQSTTLLIPQSSL
jgi:hypothetical protein